MCLICQLSAPFERMLKIQLWYFCFFQDSKTLNEGKREALFKRICESGDHMGWKTDILSPNYISNGMLARLANLPINYSILVHSLIVILFTPSPMFPSTLSLPPVNLLSSSLQPFLLLPLTLPSPSFNNLSSLNFLSSFDHSSPSFDLSSPSLPLVPWFSSMQF